MNGAERSATSAANPERLGPVLAFMRALWDADHALTSASKQMKRRLGVSGPERFVLRIVGELPDISPGELAGVMHVDPSSLTGVLKRLVDRKLLLRRSDPGDARKSRLQLTARGAALDRTRGGTLEAGVRAALDALDPSDVATTMVVLGALARTLNGNGNGATPRRGGRDAGNHHVQRRRR